ncbi:MAG: hypothetical protein HY735_23470 [Verrucomicrobia bacterium]|nr:hypothetical protein [Verrucomicrobiota bacterium]
MIFKKPLRINVGRKIQRRTPSAWAGEVSERTVEVLPLVSDANRQGVPGWCTYSDDFADLPEVEFFCGGINTKTVTAAAWWRQGNLLHFGFDLSPSEMNETGQAMLLNSIAYVSRFTEDQPIAVTPSVFAGPVPRLRNSLKRLLARDSVQLESVEYMLAPSVITALREKGSAALREWLNQNGDFLYPETDGRLAVDSEAISFHTPPAQAEFIEKAIGALRESGSRAQTAASLLRRYAPDGPSDGAAQAWEKWWTENGPYLFFSEAGGYRYYVDPLAKKRGVPTRELRGPARSSVR